MRTEQLLKNISEMIKKHEGFLAQNPDIFLSIQDRLLKAIDDEDYGQLSSDDYDYGDTDYGDTDYGDTDYGDTDYGDTDYNILDDETQYDNDYGYEDEDAQYDASKPIEYEEIDQEPQVSQASQAPQTPQPKQTQPQVKPQIADTQSKPKRTKSAEWKPRNLNEVYANNPQKVKDIQSSIDNLIGEGYTHREAERMMNAHLRPESMDNMLFNRTKKSAPSEKFIQSLKQYATKQLTKDQSQRAMEAKAEENPSIAQDYLVRSTIGSKFDKLKDNIDNFKSSDQFNNMSEDEQDDAIQEHILNYLSENEDDISSSADKIKEHGGSDIKENRKKYLEDHYNRLRGTGDQVDGDIIAGESGSRSVEQQSMADQKNKAFLNLVESPEYENMSDEEKDQAWSDLEDQLNEQFGDEDYSNGYQTSEGAMQAAGGGRDEEGAAQISTEEDPFMQARRQYPELANLESGGLGYGQRKERVSELATKDSAINNRLKQIGLKKPEGGE